jgi:hypothetical protein
MDNSLIKNSKHCELCKNKLYKIESGTYCGLTKKRPLFKNKCDKIEFNEKLNEKIKSINIDFEKVKVEKKWVYLYFFVFLAMGIGMFIFSYFFVEYISNILKKAFIGKSKVVFPIIVIVFISIGFILLNYAFGVLNRFRYDKTSILNQKNEFDNILKNYNIDYNIKVTLRDKILKPTEIETEVDIVKK